MGQKIIVTILAVLVILGLSIYGYFRATPGNRGPGQNKPQIEISPKFFDFGEVIYGQVLEYDFALKNIGQDVLEIKRVATSCACTSAKTGLENINPGQETKLSVRYETGAMSGPHGRGAQERIIFIQSNDPINPQVEVKITAYVK